MATRKLQVEIIGDASSLQKALGRAGSSSNKLGGSLKTLGKVAAVGVGAAFVGMAVAVRNGFDELAEGQQVTAQTNAALKSTGGIANVTAKEIDALAQSISRKTGIDDEAVQASENMLLTFTKVRNEAGKNNDVFNQATQAVADMATRMNNGAVPTMEQLSTTSIRVGKALNDPIKGVGALSRVGVQFTEDQKKMISEMVKSGDVMGAQKVILRELSTEFGGSAKAAGETLPGQLAKLRNSFDEVSGQIAQVLLPYLMQFLDWTNRNMPTIQRVITTVMNAIVATIQFLGPIIGRLIEVFRELSARTQEYWPRVQAVIQSVINWFRTNIVPTVQAVVNAILALWRRFGDEITTVVQRSFGVLIGIIRTVLINVRAIIEGVMALIRGDWSAAWNALKTIVTNTLSGLGGTLRAILLGLVPAVLAAGAAIGRAIVDGIWSGFQSLIGGLASRIAGGVMGAIGSVKGALKIGSPSRVTADEIGKPLGEGVIMGWIEGTRDLPEKMSEKVKSAISAAAAAIRERQGVLEAAFSELASASMAAFDKITDDHLTKTEKKIQQQDARREAQARQQTLTEAQTGLAEAQAGGDPEAILAAQRQVNEALFAIQRANDEKKAAQERKAYEEKRARQAASFQRDLEQLQTGLMNQELTAEQFNKRLIALFKKYEIPFNNAAKKLGFALSSGLHEAADAVGRAAQAVRNEIMRHLGNIQIRVNLDVVTPDRPDRDRVPGRQHGGPVRRGFPYVVGEVGPELFIPNQSGRIIPNSATAGAAGSWGPTVIVYGDVTGEELIDKVREGLLRVNLYNPGNPVAR